MKNITVIIGYNNSHQLKGLETYKMLYVDYIF